MPDRNELRCIAEGIVADLDPDDVAMYHQDIATMTREDIRRFDERYQEVFPPIHAFLAVVAEGDEQALRDAAGIQYGPTRPTWESLLIGAACRLDNQRRRSSR